MVFAYSVTGAVPQAKPGYIYQHSHKDGGSTEQTLALMS